MQIADRYPTMDGRTEYRVTDGKISVLVAYPAGAEKSDDAVIAAAAPLFVPPPTDPSSAAESVASVKIDINPKTATKAYQYTVYSDTPLVAGKIYNVTVETKSVEAVK
jgi:hypothetical protein